MTGQKKIKISTGMAQKMSDRINQMPQDTPELHHAAMVAAADTARYVMADTIRDYYVALQTVCAKRHNSGPARQNRDPRCCPVCLEKLRSIREVVMIIDPDARP